MSSLSRDIVHLVAAHIEATPLQLCELSLVNKTFREVFTSDTVWNRCNVYQLQGDIYKHFIDSVDREKEILHYIRYAHFGNSRLDRLRKAQVPLTTFCKNRYIWLQYFLTVSPHNNSHGWLWPKDAPDDTFFIGLVIQISPCFVESYAIQFLDNPYVMQKLIGTTAIASSIVGEYFSKSAFTLDRKFCKSLVENIQVYKFHPYQYFDSQVRTDTEIMDIVHKSCPMIILKAMNEPSEEFVKRYLPTEDIFKSLIKGKGSLVTRYLPFYNSCDTLLAALTCDEHDTISNYFDDNLSQLWDHIEPFHLEDKSLVLRLLELYPWGFYQLPVEQMLDKDILLAVTRCKSTLWLLDTDSWLQYVLDLPAAASIISQNRDILLALLTYVRDETILDQIVSKLGANYQLNSILQDFNNAMTLLKTSAFWINLVKIPLTFQILKTILSCYDRDIIIMKYSLPTYCLEIPETLRYGAGVFRNILNAPVHLLNREIVLENIYNGGLHFACLPKSFLNDAELLCELLQAGLYGPVYNLLRYQENFSSEALFDWKVMKIFFQERLMYQTLCEFRRMQKYPLWNGQDPFLNLLEYMQTAKVYSMVESHGSEYGISVETHLDLIANLAKGTGSSTFRSNKRRRTLAASDEED